MFFVQDSTDEVKSKVLQCLELIKFGISNTIVTFHENYYLIDRDVEADDRGLTIGGYKSAWLADLVDAYVLEKTKDLFSDMHYYGLYRDDGIIVFDQRHSILWCTNWFVRFQNAVNLINDNAGLEFTMEIWNEGGRNLRGSTKGVSINLGSTFPFLDMNLFWEGEFLQTKVYMKENQ